MLKRMLFGGLALAGIGAAFQVVRGMLDSSQPLWDCALVTVMALTGVAGGYFDYRRDRASRK